MKEVMALNTDAPAGNQQVFCETELPTIYTITTPNAIDLTEQPLKQSNKFTLGFQYKPSAAYGDKNKNIFQKSIYPKVKKYPKTTSLDWTLPNLWVPSGHTSNVNFHVSIRTKVSNGQTSKQVIMDAMSDIDTSAYYSVSGECEKGSAEVIRVLKSESKTSSSSSSSSSSTNSKLNKVKSLCTELGFKSGTEKHGDCVMKLLDN
jgi:hypothetical protein